MRWLCCVWVTAAAVAAAVADGNVADSEASGSNRRLRTHPLPGGNNNRRQEVIQEWVRKIKQSPRGHSLSPSWSGKSPYQVRTESNGQQ